MRTILRLSGWTFGLVVANQVALLVVLALSEQGRARGRVSAYTYAYTFFQLPYGVVAVSIMSATAPELTARWARGDLVAFRRRMGTGLRAMLAVVIPAAGGELVLARPLVALVLGHGAAGSATGDTARRRAGHAVRSGCPGSASSSTPCGCCRAVQDLRSAFWLYALENGVNIVLAVALAGPFGVRGIALSISIAYTVAALVALGYVRDPFQGLGGTCSGRPLGHVVLATVRARGGGRAGQQRVGVRDDTASSWAGWCSAPSPGRPPTCSPAGPWPSRRRRGTPTGRPRRPARPAPDRARGRGPRPVPRRGTAPGRGATPARRPGGPAPPAGRPPLRPGRLGPTRRPSRAGRPTATPGCSRLAARQPAGRSRWRASRSSPTAPVT